MSQRLNNLKRFTSVFICIVILYFISLYWVLSGTLLNPAFYNEVLYNKKVSSSLYDVPQILSDNARVNMSTNTIKNNILSLVDGFIRYITQSDMTLSDIAFEGNVMSLNAEILSESQTMSAQFPEISRIHPFAITYFVPDSKYIYQYLCILQQGYAIYRFFSPAMFLIGLLMVLLSKKVPENLRRILVISSIAIGLTGLSLLVLSKSLFVIAISNALGINSDIIKPIIQKMCLLVFKRIIQLCLVFIVIALLTKIQFIAKIIKGNSKQMALILLVFAGLVFIIFRNEISNNVAIAVNSNIVEHEIYTLDQEDGTVHSLTIKLKDEQTHEAISDVQIMLIKTDFSVRFTTLSDNSGNARFILPQGDFFLYANQSTIPKGLVSFEPVIISLYNPDSSWYTFHLTKSNNEGFNPETLNLQIFETFETSDQPSP